MEIYSIEMDSDIRRMNSNSEGIVSCAAETGNDINEMTLYISETNTCKAGMNTDISKTDFDIRKMKPYFHEMEADIE